MIVHAQGFFIVTIASIYSHEYEEDLYKVPATLYGVIYLNMDNNNLQFNA